MLRLIPGIHAQFSCNTQCRLQLQRMQILIANHMGGLLRRGTGTYSMCVQVPDWGEPPAFPYEDTFQPEDQEPWCPCASTNELQQSTALPEQIPGAGVLRKKMPNRRNF